MADRDYVETKIERIEKKYTAIIEDEFRQNAKRMGIHEENQEIQIEQFRRLIERIREKTLGRLDVQNKQIMSKYTIQELETRLMQIENEIMQKLNQQNDSHLMKMIETELENNLMG